jgi:purine-cytosine permease-like protein
MSHPGWLALNSATIAHSVASSGGNQGGKTNPIALILIPVLIVIVTAIRGIRYWARRRRKNDGLTRIDDGP